MHFRLHRQFFPVLPFALVAHPLFGLSDPTRSRHDTRRLHDTGSATASWWPNNKKHEIRATPMLRPNRKSKQRANVAHARANTSTTDVTSSRNTSSTDVKSSRNTESGIRIRYKIQGQGQEGIRNPGSRGKRDYVRGTTRELRGKP